MILSHSCRMFAGSTPVSRERSAFVGEELHVTLWGAVNPMTSGCVVGYVSTAIVKTFLSPDLDS